jgi:hypothetical protein
MTARDGFSIVSLLAQNCHGSDQRLTDVCGVHRRNEAS